MLVLTRKLNEQIYITKDIIITIVDIKPGCVKVGIDADKEIPIYRAEVYDRFVGSSIPSVEIVWTNSTTISGKPSLS